MNILFNFLGYFHSDDSTHKDLVGGNDNTEHKELVGGNNNQVDLKDFNPSLKKQLLQKRQKCIGSKCQIFYEKDPLVVDRARMQYIYDEFGNQYLDCISNVQHVGHSHPLVVQRITEQMSRANCNIRFVSSRLTECAEAILKTLPSQLDTVLFCNSGSEANDLAMRLARDFTQHEDIIALDHAYHGHLISTMQISPYKFDHGSTVKKPEWVHVAPAPDSYRGKYRLADEQLRDPEACQANATLYADDLARQIHEEIHDQKRTLAAYIAEALQSCGGQILPAKGYFAKVAQHVRAAGGLMIMDEVQTGFGRVGQRFWAHQLNDETFVPDILTIGKPIGNGFPVSCVITRKEIADKLGGQVGYFNTYGGNPVSCAAVLAVLEVIERDNLVEHSRQMSEHFERELHTLQAKHQCIGDVRGVGMFWGLDMVKDRQSREPDTQLALDLCLLLREEYGVLLNADGPATNILKYKPPMCFNQDDLMTSIRAIDHALTRLTS